MTIIVFLIDTSASMNQKTYLGTTNLDLAKAAVETFLKLRQKDPSRTFDRYMLLSFEEPPKHIKAGWKENQATFAVELKSLRASGLTTYGSAVASAFHLLNTNRLQSGIDTFGCGRCPFYLEPVIIISITDGNNFTYPGGVSSEVEFRMPACLGGELCSEPFRWDQRLFTVVLRLPGHPPEVESSSGIGGGVIPSDSSSINLMCEVTGGRSYSIRTLKMLNQCLESLVQKVQHGVVLFFEKYGPDPVSVGSTSPSNPSKENGIDSLENGYIQDPLKNNKHLNHLLQQLPVPPPNSIINSRPASPAVSTSGSLEWHSVRRMVYVPRTAVKTVQVGHWPMPEGFWPDPQSSSLPARTAHPSIKFKCDECEPMVLESFPFDKYELEPSPLTQKILERKQPTTCWQVFVPNSGKHGDIGAPFGYLKASTNLTTVNLFVMPYNYPKLLPMIKELQITHKNKPSKEWKASFDKYLKGIPAYYQNPLKKALQRMGLGQVMPEQVEGCLSYSVVAYLKRVKHEAKLEFDRLCQSAAQHSTPHDHFRLAQRSPLSLSSILRNSCSGSLGLANSSTSSKAGSEVDKLGSTQETIANLKKDLNEFQGFTVHIPPSSRFSRSWLGVPSNKFLSTLSLGRSQISAQFRNPFDVSRSHLIDQVTKMRTNLAQYFNESLYLLAGGLPGSRLKLQQAEELHSLPVDQMGNYHDYQRRMAPPLREIETVPVRQHAFGNPFKVDKRMLVDEADIDNLMNGGTAVTSGGQSKPGGGPGGSENRPMKRPSSPVPSLDFIGGSRKRKPGPLPRDFKYKRRRPGDPIPLSPISEPPSPAVESLASNEDGMDVDNPSLILLDGPEENELRIEELDLASGPPIIDIDNLDVDSEIMEITYPEPMAALSPEIEAQPMPMPSSGEMSGLRLRVARLVRKPGKDWSEMFDLLRGLPIAAQRELAIKASTEARRFKRDVLFEKLVPFCDTGNSKASSSSSLSSSSSCTVREPRPSAAPKKKLPVAGPSYRPRLASKRTSSSMVNNKTDLL